MGWPSGGTTRARSSETPCSGRKRTLHKAADPETQNRLGEMATRESNDPLVLADAAHPERSYELIDLAGGDAVEVGFMDHRRERPLSSLVGVE